MVWVHETQANARQGGQEGREAAMVKQYAAMTREMHTWKGLTIFPYRFLVPFSSPRPRQRCNLEASVRGLPCELGFPKSRWLAVGEPLAAHCPYPTGPAACARLHPARTMPARTRRHRYAMLALRCVCSSPVADWAAPTKITLTHVCPSSAPSRICTHMSCSQHPAATPAAPRTLGPFCRP